MNDTGQPIAERRAREIGRHVRPAASQRPSACSVESPSVLSLRVPSRRLESLSAASQRVLSRRVLSRRLESPGAASRRTLPRLVAPRLVAPPLVAPRLVAPRLVAVWFSVALSLGSAVACKSRDELEKERELEASKVLVERLERTNACVGCDIKWVDLSGKNFAGADLRGANLFMVVAPDSNFRGADLTGGMLLGQLQRADLRDMK